MFEELAPMLKRRSLVLILSAANDDATRLRLNVVPKAHKDDTDQDKALLVPLTVEGTALEMDENLAEALSSYREAHLSMQESVDATKKQMADAKAAADLKAKEDAKNKSGKTTTTAKAATPAAKPTPTTANLFDGQSPAPAAPASLFGKKEEEEDDSQDDEKTDDDSNEDEDPNPLD